MKLEQQVVSKELSVKLKELGVKQKSLFFYDYTDEFIELRREGELEQETEMREWFFNQNKNDCSAFTVAELGEMLRRETFNQYRVHMVDFDDYYPCQIDYPLPNSDLGKTIVENTEADARAKLLIHLIEEKIIKP